MGESAQREGRLETSKLTKETSAMGHGQAGIEKVWAAKAQSQLARWMPLVSGPGATWDFAQASVVMSLNIQFQAHTPLSPGAPPPEPTFMKKLLLMAAGLLLLAGCGTDRENSGAAGMYEPGMSGGVTGTPSGTSEDPSGSGGGGLPPTHSLKNDSAPAH
jgi:hypothetical protein